MSPWWYKQVNDKDNCTWTIFKKLKKEKIINVEKIVDLEKHSWSLS